MAEVGESSNWEARGEGEKPVVVRVKRKPDQSPLQALWLEINDRPLKRPLLDFHKLTISSSSLQEQEEEEEEEEEALKSRRRVLVQHVETVHSSQAAFDFFHSFLQPASHVDFKSPVKHPRQPLLHHKKHDQLLSKAKQNHQELAKSARCELIWKRRSRNKEGIYDEALDDVCRVYDILRVDGEETSGTFKHQEPISVEDQELFSKFLPLLKECVPAAAEGIESDIRSNAMRRDEYVYDLYAVKEDVGETEASYPFPLVQVDDDDEDFYDGPDHSDYETDDSNAEGNPLNDYPEEESTDEEEEESDSESEKSGSESGEDESESESETRTISDDFEWLDRSEDPLYEAEMNDNGSDDDGEDWKWAHR